MLPRGTSRSDAEIGLGFREVQDAHAVDEHRGQGLTGKEPSLVHLGDVRDHVGLDSPGLAHQVGQAVEQLVVRDRLERPFVFHDGNIGRPFFDLQAGPRGEISKLIPLQGVRPRRRGSPRGCGPQARISTIADRAIRKAFGILSRESCPRRKKILTRSAGPFLLAVRAGPFDSPA